MGLFLKNLNEKLEKRMEKNPLIIKTKQGRYINLAGTGQAGHLLYEAITDKAFEKGRTEGKKEGYVEASYEYEKKLLQQANEFLQQKKAFNKENEDYKRLLNEYEDYIEELEKRDHLSMEEKDYLNKLLLTERKLRRL